MESANQPKESPMLSADDYKHRRSDTLLANPTAHLDELEEIRKYMGRQSPSYVKKVNELAQLERPLNERCRVIVTIPALNEGSRLQNTLGLFAAQEMDPALFEIIVFVTPYRDQDTESAVLEFEKQYPQLPIVLVRNPLRKVDPMTVGCHRKYAADVALSRVLHRGESTGDTILVCNDADEVAMQANYLTCILTEFDDNPTRDGLVTDVTIPPSALAKPNVAAGFLLVDTFERTFAKGDVGSEEIPEPAITNGRSTAVRASVYAAVGGHNPKALIAEDWELGWLIADARGWNPQCIGYVETTGLTTDPRRYLDVVANRVPVDQQLLDFQVKPELRGLNNEEMLRHISDAFDWELFQDDADSVWYSQYSGSNDRIGKRRFELIYRATMKKLGVEFEVTKVNGIEVIKLINVDVLLARLAHLAGKTHVEVIHSYPRVYTPELIQQLKSFFSTTTGVREARTRKANEIAAMIEAATGSAENRRIERLLNAYERFSGHVYEAKA